MAPHFGDGDWRYIAEQASKEMDPAKLMILVAKLCRALSDEREGLQRYAGDEPGCCPAD
jgi:hypothetical protein